MQPTLDPDALPYAREKAANDARILAAERDRSGRVEAFPRKITVELTVDCNAYCPHCEFTPARVWQQKHDPRRILHVGWDDVLVFAPQVFPHIRYLSPSVVGEPLLYPHWGPFVELVARYGVQLEIFTNATRLTPEEVERTAPVTRAFFVSMDGGSRRTFNHYRAGTDFDDVCARVRHLCAARAPLAGGGPSVWITMTLMRGWASELPEFLRRAADLGVDGVGVCHLIAFTEHLERESLLAHPEETRRVLGEAAAVAEELGLPVSLPALVDGQRLNPEVQQSLQTAGGDDLPRPDDGRPWCKFLWREAFLGTNGDVAPCCAQGRPVVGNFREAAASGERMDLQAAWNSPGIQAMRTGLAGPGRHEACRSCLFLAQDGEQPYEAAGYCVDYGARPRGRAP